MQIEQIIEQIKKYLKNQKISFENDIIEYIGRRENYEIIKGEKKNYHYFSFDVIGNKSDQYSTDTYFIYVDEETNNLILLIGPQVFIKIQNSSLKS